MKTRLFVLLALTVIMLNGCAGEENTASGSVDTQNGVSSNIEVEVGQ